MIQHMQLSTNGHFFAFDDGAEFSFLFSPFLFSRNLWGDNISYSNSHLLRLSNDARQPLVSHTTFKTQTTHFPFFYLVPDSSPLTSFPAPQHAMTSRTLDTPLQCFPVDACRYKADVSIAEVLLIICSTYVLWHYTRLRPSARVCTL